MCATAASPRTRTRGRRTARPCRRVRCPRGFDRAAMSSLAGSPCRKYPLAPMRLSNLLATLALTAATPAAAQVCPYENLLPEFAQFVATTGDLAPPARAEAFVERFAAKHPDFYSEPLFGNRAKAGRARAAPVRSAEGAEVCGLATDHARRRAGYGLAPSRPTTRASKERSARHFPTTPARRRSASACRSTCSTATSGPTRRASRACASASR